MAAAIAVAAFAATPASAADLPPHAPLRILVVADEVNPHGLPPGDLTQPADLHAALSDPGSGLTLDASPDAVLLVGTDDLPIATAALSVASSDPAAYDVLVYFSHRIPVSGAAAQEAFVTAVEAFLVAGGGVVSFHHGAYVTAGKESMQELLGVTASGAVPWNTIDGQNVINTAPGHFVTSWEVDYPTTIAYADVANGVAADTYPAFNNTPDERYPDFVVNPSAETVEVLFASDYVQGGTTHVLGLTHRRAAWQGVVVVYQPGEYQPNALDLDGNNFQILANAIVYAADAALTPVPALGGLGLVGLAGALAAAGALARSATPGRRESRH